MISSHPLPLAARQAHPLGIAVALGAAALAGTILLAQLIHARTVAGLLAALEIIPGYRAPQVEQGDTLNAAVALVVVTVAAYVLGVLVGIPLVVLERRLERVNGMSVADVLAALDHDEEAAEEVAHPFPFTAGKTFGPVVTLQPAPSDTDVEPEPVVEPFDAVEPVRAPALVLYGRAPVAPSAGTSGARRRVAASRDRAAHRARYRYRTP